MDLDPMSIVGILGSICCCAGGAIALVALAIWLLKRNQPATDHPDHPATSPPATPPATVPLPAPIPPADTTPPVDTTPPSTVAPASVAPPAPTLPNPSSTLDEAPAVVAPNTAAGESVPDASHLGPDPESEPDTEDHPDSAQPTDVDTAKSPPDLGPIEVTEETPLSQIGQSGDACLMEDPSTRIRTWMWLPTDGGASVPAEQWTDFWGPLPPGDLDAFCDHRVVQQDAETTQPDTLEAVLTELGYPDVGAWHRVYWTAMKHFGDPSEPGGLLEAYITSERMTRHLLSARTREQQRKAQQHSAADHTLLLPVEDISVESYAACAAAAAQGLPTDQFHQVLADHGMDPVKWERVNAVWTNRMSQDASMTIMQFFGNAFQAATRSSIDAAASATPESMSDDDGDRTEMFEASDEASKLEAPMEDPDADIQF